jgi:hypothetical protein
MRIPVHTLENKGIPIYSYTQPDYPLVIANRSLQKYINRSGCLLKWKDDFVEIEGKIYAPCVTDYVETVKKNVWGYGAGIPQFDWRRVVGCIKRGDRYMGVLSIYITKEQKQQLDIFPYTNSEEQYFIETIYANSNLIKAHLDLREIFLRGIVDKIEVLFKVCKTCTFYKYLTYLKNGRVLPYTNIIKGEDIIWGYGIDHYINLLEKGVYINSRQYL